MGLVIVLGRLCLPPWQARVVDGQSVQEWHLDSVCGACRWSGFGQLIVSANAQVDVCQRRETLLEQREDLYVVVVGEQGDCGEQVREVGSGYSCFAVHSIMDLSVFQATERGCLSYNFIKRGADPSITVGVGRLHGD